VDEISVSILEIYNENIQDLLAEETGARPRLEIRQGPNGMYVTDLTIVRVEDMPEVSVREGGGEDSLLSGLRGVVGRRALTPACRSASGVKERPPSMSDPTAALP
jgi:hypothetical protein